MPASSSLVYSAAADAVRDHYRYPAGSLDLHIADERPETGFFQFGLSTCFGSCNTTDNMPGTLQGGVEIPRVRAVPSESGGLLLPFDPGDVAANLRFERYMHASMAKRRNILHSTWVRKAYYGTRKFMPVAVRRHFQRAHVADCRGVPFPKWPVDCSVELMFEEVLRLAIQANAGASIPFIWFWPEGQSACMIMTHDVEEESGRDFCSKLMDLDESAGFRASFQIIPEERYHVPPNLLREIASRGRMKPHDD